MTDSEFRAMLEKSPEKAHRGLFDEYFNYVYAIVCNRIGKFGSREDIEECVGDVFSELFIHFEKYNSQNGELRGIVGAIAKNRSIDAYRRLVSRAGRTVSIDENAVNEISDGKDLARSAENKEIQRILLNRIKQLGKPDSIIIIQKFFYCRKSSEIAAMLSLTPEAVRMRSSRAVKKLREMLEEEGITL